MHNLFYLLVSLLVSNLWAKGKVPRFHINLDEHPRKRWRHVAAYYKDHMNAAGPQMEAKIKQRVQSDWHEWLAISEDVYDEEFREEIEGMKEAVGEGPLTLQQLRLGNLLYEMQLPTMCSGIAVARPDGTMIHGRNLDFSFPFEITDKKGHTRTMDWPDITFDAVFHKGGKPLYAAAMWPGFVGVTTAMRFGGWSYQQNTRLLNFAPYNLQAAKKGGIVATLNARRLIESTPDYTTAVNMLYSGKFMAPQYFVVAGANPNEGAVITTDRLGAHEAYTPPVARITNRKQGWYLVQTNDDQFNVPMDARRPFANQHLAATGRGKITVQSMFNLMHSTPLMNLVTVYTTVMVPKSGYFRTILPTEMPPRVDLDIGACDLCVAKFTNPAPLKMVLIPRSLNHVNTGNTDKNKVAAAREELRTRANPTRPRRKLRGGLEGMTPDVTSLLQLPIDHDFTSGPEL